MYDVPPVAVNSTDPPKHIDASAGEIVPSGASDTVITFSEVVEKVQHLMQQGERI